MATCDLKTHSINCITGAVCITGTAKNSPLFAELHADGAYFKLDTVLFEHGSFEILGRLPYNAEIRRSFTLRIFFQGEG